MILSTVLSKRFKNLLNRVATHTHTTHMCKEPLKHIIFFLLKKYCLVQLKSFGKPNQN